MSQESRTFSVALVGNPNTGKSTLFNALTGLRQHTGNYPGVTVEMKKGECRLAENLKLNLIDLPGTYSLAPRSLDEMVSVDLLLGRVEGESKPNLILSIVDASNLERHLYLTSQLIGLGLPVVLAVNLVDVAGKQGITIDFKGLEHRLGIPVVPIQANKGKGIDELKSTLSRTLLQEGFLPPSGPQFPDIFNQEVTALRQQFGTDIPEFLAQRLLLDIDGHAQKTFAQVHPSLNTVLPETRERLKASRAGVPAVEAQVRFRWIREQLNGLVTRPKDPPPTFSYKLDRVLTHKVFGSILFLALMFVVFWSIFAGAQFLMDPIKDAFKWLADEVKDNLPVGPFRSLVADGIIGGVGSVLVFLPQIVILFGFIAILEDCGYMARAAFLMDKIMARCGLNGKSFIPLLSSTACAVPGIMSTRTIENKRDRFATILVAPLMSCSARLPLYFLMIYALIYDPKKHTAWVPALYLFAMYALGLIIAPLVALLLKRTLLKGETPAFVMELPSYKVPQIRVVIRRMIDAGWAFVRRAGTLILASMILIWATLYFPAHNTEGESYEAKIEEIETQIKDKKAAPAPEATEGEKEEDKELKELEEKKNKLTEEWKGQSLLGRVGKTLEPVFIPLGWDWKLGMAAIASFPAREVVVGTIGLIYGQGEVDPGELKDKPEDSELVKTFGDEIKNDPLRGRYSTAIGLSMMVFFALCAQCVSTLAVIKRETRSWAWPIFTFVYMTGLAYVGALVVYQVGKLIL